MGVKSGRRVGLTTLPPSVSRMFENVGASTSRNPKGLQGLYRNNFTFTFICDDTYRNIPDFQKYDSFMCRCTIVHVTV
jgi:hypothetical protein